MPLDIWLTNINASLNDFSLSKTFRLSFDASPLVFKGISPGMPDSPIFKNIRGVVQLNTGRLEGDIIITDGVIKNFNIIKIVLSHTLGVFGGMEGNIDKLGAQDTVIEKAEAEFSFHDKTVFIDDFLIKTNIFEFTAKGSVDQGLNMDMQTMLHLNGDVSAALVNEFDGLKYLMDDSKRIAIDASLKGVIPHLKYKPNKDFRKKSKKEPSMPCSDSSSGLNIRLDLNERLVKFDFAKITCSGEIGRRQKVVPILCRENPGRNTRFGF